MEEQHLDSLLEGYTIIGVEPCDYPVTEGFIFYLADRTGKDRVLKVEATEEDPVKYIKAYIAKP